MATKRGKKPAKKVKSLKAKGVSADKAKRVRGGGLSAGLPAVKSPTINNNAYSGNDALTGNNALTFRK